MRRLAGLRDYAPPGATRLMLALLSVYARDGRCTIRSVAAEAGVSVTTCKHHLERLRCAGLVAWEEGAMGTLRPTVTTVRQSADA